MKRSLIAVSVGAVGIALGVGIAGWPDRVPSDVVIDDPVTVTLEGAPPTSNVVAVVPTTTG